MNAPFFGEFDSGFPANTPIGVDPVEGMGLCGSLTGLGDGFVILVFGVEERRGYGGDGSGLGEVGGAVKANCVAGDAAGFTVGGDSGAVEPGAGVVIDDFYGEFEDGGDVKERVASSSPFGVGVDVGIVVEGEEGHPARGEFAHGVYGTGSTADVEQEIGGVHYDSTTIWTSNSVSHSRSLARLALRR